MTKLKKKSNIDKNDDIDMKISIVNASIALCEFYIATGHEIYDSRLPNELKNLEELKKKHPEYFI